MLQKLGETSSRLASRFIPDAFVFALMLSAVVYGLGVGLTPSGPAEMVGHWYEGFWSLLEFSMQMILILLTGYVLAQSSIVKRGLDRLASLPGTGRQAIFLIALVTLLAGFVNWGLGLVVGAVLSIAVAKNAKARGIRVHFPLAVAAGYMGLSIHSAGFSSTAPLLVNTEGHFLENEIGTVPLTETIITPFNLILVGIYVALIPLVLRGMSPPSDKCQEIGPSGDDEGPGEPTDPVEDGREADGAGKGAVQTDESVSTQRVPTTVVTRLENNVVLTLLVVVPGFLYIGWFFATNGFDLNINIVNFIFLMIGLAVYKTPIAYVQAITEAVRSAGGIVLQFPFYAGILGMMQYSGLVDVIAGGMVAISNSVTFPALAFLSAALVNFFVPSAGGQWAVQGPVLIEAGRSLGVSKGVIIMAHQYGDQVTNMLQPFWALPLLGLTGLKARDILGYTAVVMLLGILIFGIGITVLPLVFGL
ncbi:MAG: short-chain fatty acid transporter [Pseudonocardiaceae bacterium]|nr:short-chain fatty acid transporter [Pseudonocardiaceae bacterium]